MLLKKTIPSGQAQPDAADDPESRAELMEQLYLMYQLQPRAGLTAQDRREKAAWLRYECKRLGVPIPPHLKELHPGVDAHPDPDNPGNFTFTYSDPWDSPQGPPRLFPDEDFSDLDPDNQPDAAAQGDEGAADAAEKAAEIARWERKSLKAVKANKRAQVAFATEVLVLPIQAMVRTGLATADNAKSVKAVFDYARRMPNHA